MRLGERGKNLGNRGAPVPFLFKSGIKIIFFCDIMDFQESHKQERRYGKKWNSGTSYLKRTTKMYFVF